MTYDLQNICKMTLILILLNGLKYCNYIRKPKIFLINALKNSRHLSEVLSGYACNRNYIFRGTTIASVFYFVHSSNGTSEIFFN